MTEEIETTAREHGWVPKEEFKGDETNWVDAEKWESRSKTERTQANHIKKQEEVNEQLLGMIARLETRDKNEGEKAKKDAQKELSTKLKTAVAEGDETKVDTALEEYQKQEEPYSSEADFAAREAWLELHPEYLRSDVAGSASAESARIIRTAPGLPINEIFKRVHEKMTKIYPEHFGNKDRDKPAAVEGDGARISPAKQSMGPEFKKAMEKFATTQARYGPYKGKSDEGFEGDKKLAMAAYKRSYETELTEEEQAL